MAASSAVATHLFVRHLRWLLLGCVLMICVGLALAIVWGRKEDPAATGVGNAILSIQEFHTLLYDSGLRLRVSGDSLTVSPLKLLGPFRLGIAHSLTASAVTVETFPDTSLRSQSNLHPPSFDRFLVSLKPSFNRFLASLIPGSGLYRHCPCRMRATQDRPTPRGSTNGHLRRGNLPYQPTIGQSALQRWSNPYKRE